MKWMVVVLFATMQGDIYIFTDPYHNTQDECLGSISDPQGLGSYYRKLYEEYGKPMPIQTMACLEEQTIKEILETFNKKEV